jgi:hypothetical protein
MTLAKRRRHGSCNVYLSAANAMGDPMHKVILIMSVVLGLVSCKGTAGNTESQVLASTDAKGEGFKFRCDSPKGSSKYSPNNFDATGVLWLKEPLVFGSDDLPVDGTFALASVSLSTLQLYDGAWAWKGVKLEVPEGNLLAEGTRKFNLFPLGPGMHDVVDIKFNGIERTDTHATIESLHMFHSPYVWSFAGSAWSPSEGRVKNNTLMIGGEPYHSNCSVGGQIQYNPGDSGHSM